MSKPETYQIRISLRRQDGDVSLTVTFYDVPRDAIERPDYPIPNINAMLDLLDRSTPAKQNEPPKTEEDLEQ